MGSKIWAICLASVFVASPLLAQDLKLETQDQKISYSVGYQMGGDFKRQGQEIDPQAMVRGVQDALSEAKPLLSPEEMSGLLVQLKQKIVMMQQEERERVSRESGMAGKIFLGENAKKEGVFSLPSGLQYQVLKEGTGDKTPSATDTVTVQYRGTLIDGTEFDSSYSRGEPATFQLNKVIKGWTEGLQLMKPGAKYKFFIPPQLAYGPRGGGKIPPNSTLIFEVELLSIGGS
ncbi:MAG: FKBP-type peptidyl-prolyl cis-trans isomerase [Proteobacteria bacterium]|nr:FKBP-type peptidyl-prolyl cis-trans isomerase [Pseudomonadota bacterium]